MQDLALIAVLDISAASGLVVHGERLFAVADDEYLLAVYSLLGSPLTRVALFPGVLPEEHKARKRQKPDLESLTLLPDGRLLALGSGSTPNRNRGALITPSSEHPFASRVELFDLSALYAALAQRVPELNIEGVAAHAGRLWLAQRGNGASGMNALVELDLLLALTSLARTRSVQANALCAVHPVTLGAIEGAPLSLTDLAIDPHAGLVFSAAAEASASTYEDGECMGSVVGLLALDGSVTRVTHVAPRCKIEGISVLRSTPQSSTLLLVADPDDRARLAPLYRLELDLVV